MSIKWSSAIVAWWPMEKYSVQDYTSVVWLELNDGKACDKSLVARRMGKASLDFRF